jgi:hypothetical protein
VTLDSGNGTEMFFNNQQHVADNFNNYFVSISDNINNNNNDVYTQNKYIHKNDRNISFLQTMSQTYKPTCSKIKRKPTTTFEIEKNNQVFQVKGLARL